MIPDRRLGVLHSMLMQIESLRLVTEALIKHTEDEILASQPQPDPKACPNCGAPEEKQVDASVMGQKKVMCIVCRQERAA